MSEFQKIKNPYVVGNPIKSADMFFGREKDFQIIHDWIVTDAPHVIVLIAGRRSGKTSLLIQIKGGRLKNIGEAVFVDFHSIVPRIQNDEDFPLEIGKAILQNPIFKSFAEDFFKRDGQSWTLQLQILIERCMDKIKPRKLLVLCDEFESIEELFKSGLLSAKSLLWTRQVLNQSVYFIMTGSHEFEDNTIKTVFDVVSQKKPMYELDERDAIALIEEPVKGRLNYAAGVPHQIMRLAGAQPFYVQYVCQTLVNQINADFKRNEVLPGDLDETVKFIVKQPCGHMQESWRDPVGRKIKGNEKNRLINQIRHLLGALANSIKDSEKYVDIEAILLTAEQKHFAVSEKNIYKTLAWLKQNSRLLEWEEAAEKYRFRIELFRHWVLYTVQRGEDIVDEPVGSGSEDLPESTPMPNAQGEEYATQVQTYLADDLISLNERQHLDQLIGRLNLRQEQAERLEAAARAKQQQPPLDWLEEYKESCRVLKRQHSGKAPAASLQTLQSVYENNGRLPPQKAREIRQYIGLRGKRNKMLMWVGSVAGLAVAGLAVWWLLPANTAPNAGDDQLQTAHNAPLGFNAAGLLANDNDAEGDALRLVAVSDALHGKVHLENDQITFTPDTDFSGTAGFQYQISDERGAQTEAWVSIQVADAPAPVNPVNTAPNAGNDQLQTPYNTPLRISAAELLANDSDAEGDALRLVAVSDALHGKVHLENEQITFTPDTDFSGAAGFQYQISDERGAQTEARVSIQVADAPPVSVNTAPNAGNDQLQTPYNTPLRISAAELLANDSDAEGDALRLVAVSDALHGKVHLENDQIAFTPDTDFNGTAGFQYQINDARGAQTEARVSVQVAAPSSSPSVPDCKGMPLQEIIAGKCRKPQTPASDCTGMSLEDIIAGKCRKP